LLPCFAFDLRVRAASAANADAMRESYVYAAARALGICMGMRRPRTAQLQARVERFDLFCKFEFEQHAPGAPL